MLSPVVQLWLAERPRLGVNGHQRLFCTLQGGDLSANHVRQMVKRLCSNGSVTIRTTDSASVRRATAWLHSDHLAPGMTLLAYLGDTWGGFLG